jgi:hypothetical protein
MNQNNPLARHSRAGGNPVDLKITAMRDNLFSPLCGIFVFAGFPPARE